MTDLSSLFKDPRLLKQALTHKSHGHPHNERLEFLGDAVLGLAISHELYRRYPTCDEGMLSLLRATLVNKASLKAIGQQLSLSSHLILGPSCPTPPSSNMMANTTEALLGALYLDQGMAVCHKQILTWWTPLLERHTPQNLQKNHKSILQEWCQKQQRPLPTYQVSQVSGTDHAPCYTMMCKLTADLITEATDTSKQEAEQKAASLMLERIKEIS